MKAVILGGAGFLGTNLARRLDRDGSVVLAVDDLDPRLRSTAEGLRDLANVTFVHADIRDDQMLRDALAGMDVVFNFAAQTSHPLSVQDPLWDLELNAASALRVLEMSRQVNPSARHVYASTSTVAGRTGSVVNEDTIDRPRDHYSANKAAGEHYYRLAAAIHGTSCAILRLPNIYGPFGKPYPEFGFLNYFISLAERDLEIPIFGTGEQIRNVLFVDDAIDALLLAADERRLESEPYYVGGDEHLSVRRIAETIVSVFGRGRLAHAAFPAERQRIDPGSVFIDSGRFRALTGWRPRIGLREGLELTRRSVADVRLRHHGP